MLISFTLTLKNTKVIIGNQWQELLNAHPISFIMQKNYYLSIEMQIKNFWNIAIGLHFSITHLLYGVTLIITNS